MPNIPTPLRAALGLAATAVDEARRLPETLPQAVTTVPVIAVSHAMQVSLKLQQRLATLAARGDEVLSQLRGTSAEPPSWASFDDSPVEDGSGDRAGDDAQAGRAAFDLIDYDNTGFEGAEGDEGSGRWDAVGVGGTEVEASPTLSVGVTDPLPGASGSGAGLPDLTLSDKPPSSAADAAAAVTSGVSATAPVAAGPTEPAAELAEAVSAPGIDVPPRPGRGRAAKTAPAKTAPGTSAPAKSAPVKMAPAKSAPAKGGPGGAAPAFDPAPTNTAPSKTPVKRRATRAPQAEPLERAAEKAKPSAAPNPATMAAEIMHAHEAAADDE